MSLDAHAVVRRGDFALDVPLTAADGEVVGVLGPNGAGKSTLLRALAGLVPLDGGHVRLGPVVLDGGHVRLGPVVLDDVAAGVRTPPERRGTGFVFQDYLLFPHLSAVDNVAYGPRARGLGRADARAVALSWLDRMGLSTVAGQRPGQLSGGQAQRVALARALAAEPRLLLLDEPLAALDAGTRLNVRADLRRHLTSYGGPAVVVTHDPVEAMVLADRLVVLEDGRIVQSGLPAEVARRPRTAYVASLVGLNLYRGAGAGAGGRVVLDGGGALVASGAGAGAGAGAGSGAGAAGGAVLLAVRPSAVALHRERPTGSPRNVWPGRVAGLESVGDRVRVAVAGTPAVLADVTPAAVAELRLAGGEEVWVSVKASEVDVYPA